MSERADSMLVYDLRAFAQNYSGTPFGSRCKTAADELDRLYELERRYEAGAQRTSDSRSDIGDEYTRSTIERACPPPPGEAPNSEGGK